MGSISMEVVMAYLRHLSTMTSEGSGKPRQTEKRKPCLEKWLWQSVSHMTSAYTRLITLQKLVTMCGLCWYGQQRKDESTRIGRDLLTDSTSPHFKHSRQSKKKMNTNHLTKHDVFTAFFWNGYNNQKNIPQALVLWSNKGEGKS